LNVSHRTHSKCEPTGSQRRDGSRLSNFRLVYGTGQPPQRFRGMVGNVPSRRDGLDASLAIHLALYCAVAGCFALVLYFLLQPSRSANPGLAAYKPPPATVLPASVASLADGAAQPPARVASVPQPIAAAPEVEATDVSAPRQSDAKQTERHVKPVKPKRPRTASRKQRRNPLMDYAAQPFGAYRPWF
jgi:hypothetical protein